MKVLIVARCKNGKYAPFISEQVDAIMEQGIDCRYFGITGKGIIGYIRLFPGLIKAIRAYKPDVIHAHYGLCGLLANYQRKVPVVTTYHGSDINDPKVFRLSKKAIKRSRFNIFVSHNNLTTANPNNNYALIPCGINLDDFPLMEKAKAVELVNIDPSRKTVLFAGSFDNPVKNATLAKEAMRLVPEASLLELKGYSRLQVAALMQVVDALLLTSYSEGSPQVIKEALACGCPIVSVDVGDVKERVLGVDGCFVTPRDVHFLADSLRQAISFVGRTHGREAIVRQGLTNDRIATQLIEIYHVCKK